MLGIVSVGVECGREDFPTIYARISAFDDWIQGTICNVSSYPPEDCEPPPPVECDPATDPCIFRLDLVSVMLLHSFSFLWQKNACLCGTSQIFALYSGDFSRNATHTLFALVTLLVIGKCCRLPTLYFSGAHSSLHISFPHLRSFDCDPLQRFRDTCENCKL